MGWAWCIIIQCPSSGVLGSTGWALQLVWSSRRRRRLRWERMVTSSLSMWISWRYRQPHHKYTVGMYLYVGVYIYICRNTQNINKQKHTEALTYNWDWNCSNWWPTSTRELLAATSLYTLYIFVFSMPLCPPPHQTSSKCLPINFPTLVSSEVTSAGKTLQHHAKPSYQHLAI